MGVVEQFIKWILKTHPEIMEEYKAILKGAIKGAISELSSFEENLDKPEEQAKEPGSNELKKPEKPKDKETRAERKKRITDFLEENCKTMNAQEMARELNISDKTVYTYLKARGIHRTGKKSEGKKSKIYTEEQKAEVLKQHNAGEKARKISEDTGLSIKTCYNILMLLK